MSSVINPVGPEDPAIYWRRRALVGGVALVVLFLFWFIFLRSGGGDSEPVPVAASSSAPASPSASAIRSTSPTASASGNESSSASPSPEDSGTCTDDDILVTVQTDAQSYAADETPQITMQIQNTGDTACSRNIGSDANTIEISSGGVLVWSSDDCQDPGTPDVATLEPDKDASLSVTWERTASTGGCTNPPEAAPGSYTVVGTNLGVDSDEVSFSLQ